MTINPEASPMLDDECHKQLKIVRQVSDASTMVGKSPAGASCCEDDPYESLPFRRLDSMDEDDEQASEDEGPTLSPAEEDLEPLWQGCTEPPRLCLGMPPLQSELGRWAQWAVAAEEWQSRTLGMPVSYECEGGNPGTSGDSASVADESTEAGEDWEPEEVPAAVPTLPPLWQDCEEPAHICLGLPPLQSSLGRWAQWAVTAEEWQSAVLGTPVTYTYGEEESDDPSSSDEE